MTAEAHINQLPGMLVASLSTFLHLPLLEGTLGLRNSPLLPLAFEMERSGCPF